MEVIFYCMISIIGTYKPKLLVSQVLYNVFRAVK